MDASGFQRPETDAQAGIVDRRFPVIPFREIMDVSFALFRRHRFPGPDPLQVVLEDHAEFFCLQPVLNLRGQGVQRTPTF